MENFRWASDRAPASLTEKFILSYDQVPQLSKVVTPEAVPLPIIDMGGDVSDEELAGQVARASEEFGFFKIINHGFPEEVWLRAAESARDFFLLPAEVKSCFAGEGGAIDSVKVYSYFLNDWEDGRKVNMWSEVLNHLWHPSSDFAASLPANPPNYRYVKESNLERLPEF